MRHPRPLTVKRLSAHRKRTGLTRQVFHLFILLMTAGAAIYGASHSYDRGYAQGGGAEATSGLSYSGVAVYGAVAEAHALSLAPLAFPAATSAPPQAVLSTAAAPGDAVRLSAARAPGQIGTPQPAASPAATPTPAGPDCDRTVSQLFCVYTVQPGDTLSKIATQFGLKGSPGVAPWELLVQSNKPDIISSDDPIQPGQKLRVPLKNGVVHTVLTGETMGELAAGYGVTVAAISEAGNSGGGSGLLNIGQDVLIPDPTRLPATRVAEAPAPAATPAPAASAAPEPTSTPAGAVGDETPAVPPPIASATAAGSPTPAPTKGSATPVATRTPSKATATPGRSAAGFIWPATGPISSYFGPGHPLGIDIDFYANPNQPVVAAAAGVVTFAGGNTCCSYGLYVIVDHGNGFTTLYAHLSRIAITQGQKVTQGQVLGYGGHTGYATGDHLHFEVRLNDAVINPLSVLP